MKEKTRNLILKIARIKINLGFVIIFMGGILYSAERLGEAILLKEIFFWVSIMLVIMFQCFTPLSEVINMIEEYIVNKKDVKRGKSE